MKRADLLGIGFLIAVIIIVFYPVFYAVFLYSDEATQLWYFNTDLNFDTSVPQGRYLTYTIFVWVFSSIHSIQGVIHARLFSLAGWIICLPVWYYIMMRLVTKNGLPKIIGTCSLVYLICMPPFAISIGWSACMELFVAYTAGLLSGYILYEGITAEGKMGRVSAAAIGLSALLGIISLFTYQNGFGCFYLPFFIAFVASKRITKNILIGIGISILIYIVYYLLAKYSMSISALPVSRRTALVGDPVNKLMFFFARPMAAAFHFTWLVNEQNKAGLIASILLGALWMVGHFIIQKRKPILQSFSYLLILPVFFALIYLPSLIVEENFASNRTLLALDMAVFILVAETIFSLIKQQKARYLFAGGLCMLFLINGWYNFNRQFLAPLLVEFAEMKDDLDHHYGTNVKIIDVIRPREDAFGEKYGLVQSWDEFGVPSAAKSWAIEPLIKQLVYEKTGSRQAAENLVVNNWPDMEAFQRSGAVVTDSTLLIDCGK